MINDWIFVWMERARWRFTKNIWYSKNLLGNILFSEATNESQLWISITVYINARLEAFSGHKYVLLTFIAWTMPFGDFNSPSVGFPKPFPGKTFNWRKITDTHFPISSRKIITSPHLLHMSDLMETILNLERVTTKLYLLHPAELIWTNLISLWNLPTRLS